MSLTAPTVLWALTLVTVALFGWNVVAWPRSAGPGIPAFLSRVGRQLAIVVLALLTVGVALNDQYDWYANWADLTTLFSAGAPDGTILAAGVAAGAAAGAAVAPGSGSAPGDRPPATTGTPAGLQLVASPGPNGQYQQYTVGGPASGVTGSVTVWFPAAYTDPAEERRLFPVLEAFHGIPGTPSQWAHGLHLGDTVAASAAAGRIADPILVLPNIAPNAIDTECVDGSGQEPHMETWLAKDVPDWITTHLRVQRGRGSWATLGLSAGAYCAAMVTMLHPDRFSAAISLGGYYQPSFDRSFVPFAPDSAAAARYDLVRLARTNPPPVALWLQTSQADPVLVPGPPRSFCRLPGHRSRSLLTFCRTPATGSPSGHRWCRRRCDGSDHPFPVSGRAQPSWRGCRRGDEPGRSGTVRRVNTVTVGWPLAGVLFGLAGSAALVTRIAQLGRPVGVLSAAVRAVAQLAVVSLVIGVVLRSLGLTAAFLILMVAVAAGTSARRVTGSLRAASWWTVAPILCGVAVALGAILVSGVMPLDPVAILPSGGILIGGAMTATSIAGRRLSEELTSQKGSYEAALSVGLSRRDAVTVVARDAAGLALVPGLDQTRTVGLVTLPGAFVGVLLAGASPLQAGSGAGARPDRPAARSGHRCGADGGVGVSRPAAAGLRPAAGVAGAVGPSSSPNPRTRSHLIARGPVRVHPPRLQRAAAVPVLRPGRRWSAVGQVSVNRVPVDRIADIWGSRTPFGRGEKWPVRVDQVLAEGLSEADVDRWVQSACVLCSNGCGCDIAVKDGADGRDPRPRRRPRQPRPARPQGPVRQLAGRVRTPTG